MLGLTSAEDNGDAGVPGLLSIPRAQGIAHADTGRHTKAKGQLRRNNHKS